METVPRILHTIVSLFLCPVCIYVQGIDEPLETYFWPAEFVCVNEEEEEEEESEDEGDESVDVSTSTLYYVCALSCSLLCSVVQTT